MGWKWLKKVKDVYSWYSFSSGIAGLTGLSLIVSPVVALVVGVVGAAIKGVPWPITVMAGFCTFVAGAYLVALPIFIRAETRPVPEPNKAPQPIRPNWDAWKHVEKFTVRKAACLLENMDPTTHLHDPKIDPWIHALCAAIRKGEMKFILNKEELGGYHVPLDSRNVLTKQQMQSPTALTEIPKEALMDFEKRNNIDLKSLGQ
jgi:hypothetical protein